MTNKKIEIDTLKKVLLMLHRRYKQVASEDAMELNAKQIHAYTIARAVLWDIIDEIANFILTGEDKEYPIKFDDKGYMIY